MFFLAAIESNQLEIERYSGRFSRNTCNSYPLCLSDYKIIFFRVAFGFSLNNFFLQCLVHLFYHRLHFLYAYTIVIYKRFSETKKSFQLFANYRRVKMKIKLIFYLLAVVVGVSENKLNYVEN